MCQVLIGMALLAVQVKEVAVVKVSEENLVKLLNGIEVLERFSTSELSVRVLASPNASGSAGRQTGEVTTTLYIAVSEQGEFPKQSLFKLSAMVSPRIEQIKKEASKAVFYISYVDVRDQRVFCKVLVALDKAEIIK